MSFFNYPGTSRNSPDLSFLSDATAEEWQALIRHTGYDAFVEGDVLIEAGSAGDAFYIIVEGAVDVVERGLFGERAIARIDAGSIFGEIAFLDGGVRTATVRAATNGRLIRITRNAFTILQSWEPGLALRMVLDLGRICATRLRRGLRISGR